MFILSYANVLCICPKLCLQDGSAFWLRTYLINQYVILRYCSSNLCKWNYLYGDLPFFKIQVNHFMAQGESFGAKIIQKYILWVRGLMPFWVLRHSFLSLTDCWWPYNIQLKINSGVLCLPSSDANVKSFLYLLYTLIKLYYTKALSDQASFWPQIEFSSGGQESRCRDSTSPLAILKSLQNNQTFRKLRLPKQCSFTHPTCLVSLLKSYQIQE